MPFYEQVKNLKKLETNEEKLAKSDLIELQKKADTSFQYEREGYMSRQPRVDLTQYNYNFEQFKEYTTLYERSKKKDTDDLTAFYKMVKYVNENVATGDQRAVALSLKFRFDLIQIPEEFKNVEADDSYVKKNKSTGRVIIRNRTSRDITNYDAWRVYDRQIIKGGPK